MSNEQPSGETATLRSESKTVKENYLEADAKPRRRPSQESEAVLFNSPVRTILLSTLITTIGWAISVPSTVLLFKDWSSALVAFGVIGGFVNAFALWRMEPSLTQRHLLYLVSAWAIPFICITPVVKLARVWGFTWALSGLSTGVVLRQVGSY